MEENVLRIEYKKFNTFLFDYIKTISQGWLFMRMKNKYPVDTELFFQFNVTGIEEQFKIKGRVIYNGLNDEGKDGIGINLSIDDKTTQYIVDSIELNCKDRFGDFWTEKIMDIARKGS